MARILHVENEEIWRQIVRESLEDHHVDSAKSVKEAVALLQGTGAAYDVALIDLNLETDSDGQGGEVMDLLLSRYPSTRRIVVTGSPPPGALRKTVFERYDAEEIIIKRTVDIPDLRRVVEEAIARGPAGLSQQLRFNRSALRQRFRDWQGTQAERMSNDVREAEKHLEDSKKVSAQTAQRAQLTVLSAKSREFEFTARSATLKRMLTEINTVEDLNTALEALDAAEEHFGANASMGDG
jgi:CheY-like chemotaxis protein